MLALDNSLFLRSAQRSSTSVSEDSIMHRHRKILVSKPRECQGSCVQEVVMWKSCANIRIGRRRDSPFFVGWRCISATAKELGLMSRHFFSFNLHYSYLMSTGQYLSKTIFTLRHSNPFSTEVTRQSHRTARKGHHMLLF